MTPEAIVISEVIAGAKRIRSDCLDDPSNSRSLAPGNQIDSVSTNSAKQHHIDNETDPMAMFDQWEVTDEQVEAMIGTKLIWREVIASSHVSVWAAPANGGKTTIARLAAEELAKEGYKVTFFQEDASAGDLPELHKHAKHHGYKLLNYYVLSSLDLRQFNAGAAVPTLNRNDIHGLDALVPPRDLQKRFQAIAGAMLTQSRELDLKIQNLRRTRDLLMPRLLSGQITLSKDQ